MTKPKPVSRPRTVAPPQTPFGRWLSAAVNRRGIDYAELGRRVDSDYNYIWQLATGRKQRPGYELAVKIGREVGDEEGAIRAAFPDAPPPEEGGASDESALLVAGQVLPSGIRILARGPDGQPVTLSDEDLRRIDPHFVIAKERAEGN